MASTNHKAGLAVVVPVSDNRSQPQGVGKQDAYYSPRRLDTPSMNMSASHQSHGSHSARRLPNGSSSWQQSNGTVSVSQANGIPSSRLPSSLVGKHRYNPADMQRSDSVGPRQPQSKTDRPNGAFHGRPRLLGVEEALPYSPFSSVVPFSSDIIPVPNADLPSSRPFFPTLSEQNGVQNPLDYLNQELSKSSGPTSLAQRISNDLKPYLNSDAITDFKFKNLRKAHGGQEPRDSGKGSHNSGVRRPPTVSPFANMLLEATDLAHRYPTPTSPGQFSQSLASEPRFVPTGSTLQTEATSQVPKLQQSAPILNNHTRKTQQQSPVTPTTQVDANNLAAYSHNSRIPAKGIHVPASVQKQPTPMVVIPLSSAEAHRNEFITYKESPEKGDTRSSGKRKREGEKQSSVSISQTKDQRAVSEEILRQFQDLIQDVFEAEDQTQFNSTSGDTSSSTEYFIQAFHEERDALTLSPAVHVKLESLLQKLTNAGKFAEIPVEQLQHLQRLSEGSLIAANSLDLKIDFGWDTESFFSWAGGLDAVDAGLRSARTILRIMIGGREEKELYPEELLQSLLGLVKSVLEKIIIPIAEARSSGSSSTICEGLSLHKKAISQLLFDIIKAMSLLGKLLAKVEMAETIITSIEFLAIPLLFVENSLSEKESVLGVQKFENLRRSAMEQISNVFSRYEEQRIFLLNQILASLQNLPVKDKRARQYKLAEGKSIMLVSALITQLIQISAKQHTRILKKTPRRKSPLNHRERAKSQSSDGKTSKSSSSSEETDDSEGSQDDSRPRNVDPVQSLEKDANLRMDNATRSAQYVTTYLVQRASNTAKSSESPHRQHLDMFVQDLITVLGMPEWPAAELLLRMVFASCRNIAEAPKSSAPAKNMALELLGMMGSAISDLVSSTRHAARSLDNQDTEFSGYLRQMLEDYTDGSLEISELIVWGGSYHAVLEYSECNDPDDAQNSTAKGYYLAQWAKAVASTDLRPNVERDKLVSNLQKILSGASWVLSDTLSDITAGQSRVAYALTVLTTGFCRQLDYILKILLDSITSEQISVRTRSLKSVEKMLEGDPSILDRARNVKILISNCANDTSPMVRDSALTLIGKCITLRPVFEQEFLRIILKLVDDPAVGIRKRSIKMLKDIYLRNADLNVKTVVGSSLLQRIQDLDANVIDLARQTFEDIWLSPFWGIPELAAASAQIKMDLKQQVRMIVDTVRRGEKVAGTLVQLLKASFSKDAKNTASNLKVCKYLVATAFDMMIDNLQAAERLEQRHISQTLTVFALANAMLFTPDQLQSLQPYINNISGKDDLEVFRSIVIIFRCTLPVQSSVQHKMLQDIQRPLIQSLPKLGRAELNEVAECLWTINGTLQNTDQLSRLMISVLSNLHKMRTTDLSQVAHGDNLKRVKRYIQIAGCFGAHCDFESQIEKIQAALAWKKSRTVAELIVESMIPFTASSQPLSLKVEAFESIGLICQSWPYQFTQEHISNSFQNVLRTGEPKLQDIVLSSFRDFFAKQDRQAEAKQGQSSEGVNGNSQEKLGVSMTANESDGASALIAQRFLTDVLRIALASQNDSALAATEVIASVNRQGLVHPKESGPALVALETSTNPAIADVAFQEHRLLHQQHESMFEREYMRAIQEAFRYQRDIVGNAVGFTTNPYASKLSAMFEIIKSSKTKYQKKFISNFCSKIDFDVSRIDPSETPPRVLQFSRFLTENLAFFEYGRIDDLLHTIACMEKIVADTGSGIAHSISTEVFNLTVESMPEATVPGSSQGANSNDVAMQTVDSSRLYQLTTAAIILSSLWEARTYLRRLYGQNASQQGRESKTKTGAKDLNKVPSRAQGVTGDKLLISIAEKIQSLGNEESMRDQCKDFVELLSVDSEVKVAAEDEESPERFQTPSGDDEQDMPMSGRSHGLKRKGSVSTAGTPMKKKKGRPSMTRRKSGKSVASDEDWE